MPRSLPVVDVSAPICCSPIGAGPVSEVDALALALRLKALADPVRIRLLSLLMSAGSDQISAGALAESVGVSAATASHHLAQLRNTGLVASQRQGVHVFYQAERVNLEALRTVLATCC